MTWAAPASSKLELLNKYLMKVLYIIALMAVYPFLLGAQEVSRDSKAYFDRVSLSANDVGSDLSWIRGEFAACAKEKVLPSTAAAALSGAAIKLAADKDSLEAYNYLVSRLLNTASVDEKRDIINKLYVWPGMRKYEVTTLSLLLYLKSTGGDNDAIQWTLDRGIATLSN